LRLLATGIQYSDRVKKIIRGMLEYEREQRISVEEIITEVGEF
jgi:glutamine synthetase